MTLTHEPKDWPHVGLAKNTFWLRCDGEQRDCWHCVWSMVPAAAGLSEQEAIGCLLDLAPLVLGRYGYVMRMPLGHGPSWYANGVNFGEMSGRVLDESMNITWWQGRFEQKERLLRDVYPVSFLTHEQLGAAVGETTLETWVAQASGRGSLTPLAGREGVMVWVAPPERIAQLREELFRAGVLFYWRFFDPSDPLHRDFFRPFLPPDPIPEMFRVGFFAGREPSVTR